MPCSPAVTSRFSTRCAGSVPRCCFRTARQGLLVASLEALSADARRARPDEPRARVDAGSPDAEVRRRDPAVQRGPGGARDGGSRRARPRHRRLDLADDAVAQPLRLGRPARGGRAGPRPSWLPSRREQHPHPRARTARSSGRRGSWASSQPSRSSPATSTRPRSTSTRASANARVLGNDRMEAAGLAHRSLLELVEGAYQTAATTARDSLEHAARGALGKPAAHRVCPPGDRVGGGAGARPGHSAPAPGRRGGRAGAAHRPAAHELARLLRIKLLAEEGSLPEASQLLAEHRSSPPAAPAFLQRLRVVTSAQVAGLTA